MSGDNHNQADRTVPQLRARIDAMLRLLVIEGHVSPQGARSLRQVLRGEVSS